MNPNILSEKLSNLREDIDYYQLGCQFHSIFNSCQKLLFSDKQENNLPEDIRIDIYNLLDLAKELVPREEFNLLDDLKKTLKDRNNQTSN